MEAVIEPAVETALAIPEEKSARYEFDEGFQTKIAAMVLRDTSFLQRTDGLIDPEYFEQSVDQTLVAITLGYFRRYRKAPGDNATIMSIISDAKAKKIIRPESMPLVKDRLKRLLTADFSDADYVVDKVSEFARHQAVSRAILDSVGKLDKKDFDSISKMMREALDIGENSDADMYDYYGSLEFRTEERLERAAGKLPPQGVTTGYKEIDRHLYQKGWGFRELSVLMGAAKMGKTTALLDFAVNATACLQRYNVLYVTLEVSSKILAERIDSRISEQLIMELGDHTHLIREKVEAFRKTAGRLSIKEFPSGSMTVSDLRRLIEREKAKGNKYDMVVVDYADLMAPERITDNAQENSKSVYVALRGLAMQEGCAVLTATQTNREGAKAAVATMTHVAEDFNKIRIADVIISINKTDEERGIDQARLYFAACRNQASGFSITIKQDLGRMKFIAGIVETI